MRSAFPFLFCLILSPPLQFWTDSSSPEFTPLNDSSEMSLPATGSAVHLKPHVDESGGLPSVVQQPLLHHDDDTIQSPMSAPKGFFTAIAPAGYTSVPALILCIYIIQKAFHDQSSVVGQYPGGLFGRGSKVLRFVNLLSLVFFLIPWIVRFVMFYNVYGPNVREQLPRTPCVRFQASASVCTFHYPLSNATPVDWAFMVLCALSVRYFRTVTTIFFGSAIYKASSLPPLFLRCGRPTRTLTPFRQLRRINIAQKLAQLLAVGTSNRECEIFCQVHPHLLQVLPVFSSAPLMLSITGCSATISLPTSPAVSPCDSSATPSWLYSLPPFFSLNFTSFWKQPKAALIRQFSLLTLCWCCLPL